MLPQLFPWSRGSPVHAWPQTVTLTQAPSPPTISKVAVMARLDEVGSPCNYGRTAASDSLPPESQGDTRARGDTPTGASAHPPRRLVIDRNQYMYCAFLLLQPLFYSSSRQSCVHPGEACIRKETFRLSSRPAKQGGTTRGVDLPDIGPCWHPVAVRRFKEPSWSDSALRSIAAAPLFQPLRPRRPVICDPTSGSQASEAAAWFLQGACLGPGRIPYLGGTHTGRTREETREKVRPFKCFSRWVFCYTYTPTGCAALQSTHFNALHCSTLQTIGMSSKWNIRTHLVVGIYPIRGPGREK